MLVVSRGPQAGKQINLDRSHMTVGRSTACDIVQTDLATAYVVGRNYEQAAAVGRDAVRTAAQVSSVRTLDRLRTLQRKSGRFVEARTTSANSTTESSVC